MQINIYIYVYFSIVYTVSSIYAASTTIDKQNIAIHAGHGHRKGLLDITSTACSRLDRVVHVYIYYSCKIIILY